MHPSVSITQAKRRQGPKLQTAAVLLALAAGAFGYGCQKSAADNAPGAGVAAIPVQVQIAPAVKIPDTTEYLSILKSRHSAAINPQVEGQITRLKLLKRQMYGRAHFAVLRSRVLRRA